jgi:transposase
MIFRNPLKLTVYLYPREIDMRKSWNGLLSIVQNDMKLIAYEKSLFVFFGRSRCLVKILYWDGNGFCIWMKRLETGSFPFQSRENPLITRKQLSWLLSGIDTRKEHKEIFFS